MYCVAIYSSGCFEATGYPNVFFSDDDLTYVMENEMARKDLISEYGEGVCVGRLGCATPEGFVEDEESPTFPKDLERRADLSFYENV